MLTMNKFDPRTIATIFFSLCLALLITACGGGGSSNSSSTATTNKTPTVNAGWDRKAQINVPIIIWGSASDSDGIISNYEWTKGGEVLGTTEELSYTPTKLGIDTLTLKVVDDDGLSASDSLNLEVIADAVPIEDPLPF
jgi:hypothetical protein